MIFSLSQCSIPSLLTTKITPFYEAILTAGAQGIEPWSAVLETAVLPLNDAPMRAPERRLPLKFTLTMNPPQAGSFKYDISKRKLASHFSLFMYGMLPAPSTKLLEFKLTLHLLLVFGGVVVGIFADCALHS